MLEVIENYEQRIESLENFLAEMQRRSAENYMKMKEVDARGSFASDDEVGFVFNYLFNQIIDIKTFLENYLKQYEEKE